MTALQHVSAGLLLQAGVNKSTLHVATTHHSPSPSLSPKSRSCHVSCGFRVAATCCSTAPDRLRGIRRSPRNVPESMSCPWWAQNPAKCVGHFGAAPRVLFLGFKSLPQESTWVPERDEQLAGKPSVSAVHACRSQEQWCSVPGVML